MWFDLFVVAGLCTCLVINAVVQFLMAREFRLFRRDLEDMDSSVYEVRSTLYNCTDDVLNRLDDIDDALKAKKNGRKK